ncbi:hypothetical protein HDV00_008997 [Rhizophlyctis rosea]|nr:hypothetical protein HDV00_008997 [Rhizophlyctis rosea]
MPPTPATGQQLPSKEASLFKGILKFYEHKQYKKGLKTAEQILKKFPNHGETLAMKGLFLSNLDRKEEGHECIKLGVRNDLRSHICWHVYGLYHRGEKNYEEALKCYSHALKYEKENIQILRDFSLLHLQMRNLEGFSEATHQLLELKPTNRQFWAGLAVSYHLLHKYDTAVKVLDSYEESLKEQQTDNIVEKWENSELLMYKIMVLEEGGELEKALESLNDVRTKVVDQRSWKEARGSHVHALRKRVSGFSSFPIARIFLKLKLTEAEVEYRKLLSDNPDNIAYLDGLLASRGLPAGRNFWFHCRTEQIVDEVVVESGEAEQKLARLLNELTFKYPRSHLIKRFPLKHAKGGYQFRGLIDNYLKEMFRKGVPSLFISMKDLYGDAEKAEIIEETVTNFALYLERTGRFSTDEEEDAEKEPPSAYLWVLYFLAQHHDWKRESEKALELINRAIEHTPTLVELFMTKARIYKHAGDPEAAMKAMNEARELDLQDRNVNSKCTKYMLRNDQVAEAEKTIALFTRSESTDPLGDLVDMQCMWFALECAESHARKRDFGRALKRYHQIEKHFVDIYDDTFDFHSYCFRKMTLRAYVDLLRTDDRLRSHPYYYRAAVGAAKVYLELFDKPPGSELENNPELAGLSEADRKKALRKLRKAELKSAQPEKAPEAPAAGGAKKDAKKVDLDPDGSKLVKDVDYLAEATKFVKPLVELSPGRAEGWNLAGAVYVRKGKLLLALKCIKKAQSLEPSNPDAHLNAVKLYQVYQKEKEQLPAPVREVFEAEVSTVYGREGNVDLKSFVDKYLEQAEKEKEVERVVKGAEAVLGVDGGEKEKARVLAIVAGVGSGKGWKGWNFENATAAYEALRTGDTAKAEEFKARCAESFPLASLFRA